jgi:phosphoglycerol transferase MdoB-like AlkP superfamily enzyme
MALALVGFPLLLLYLPFGWSRHRVWLGLWHGFNYLALLAFVFMMAVDLIYFGNVHRHVGSEINTLAQDMGSMVELALRQYAGALLVFAMGALGLGWAWWNWLVVPAFAPVQHVWRTLLALPLALLLMVVVARGGVGGKPISVGEAFFSNLPAQGYLALNGAFAMSRALLESPSPLKTFMPESEAVALVQQFLASDDKVFADPQYPLHQTVRPKLKSDRPNVVVLMLESWGAQHIDTLRQLSGQAPLGVTPNFDALAQQGRLYSRFYANGQRSILGAESILASQPTFAGMPFLGEGIEQNRQSFLGELARSQGYETIFLQSSERGSLRFDAIAARTGFGTYRGAEDIPNLHEHPKPADTWGTWDHNTMQAAHQLFAAAHQPFLGFVFTSTTHTPWLIPDAKFKKFSGGSDREAFLNTLLYADWALGELIAASKKAGYFNNTIFVVTADHADEFVEQSDVVPNLYHIPLLLVGPGVPSGVDDRVGSQFDILPTLIALCGWQVDYAGFGRSLLDDARKEQRAALGVRGEVLDWITPGGWVSHNLERSLGQSPGLSAQEVQKMQQLLLATYQTASQLQTGNRILPPPR